MTFKVVWTPHAEAQLAAIWLDSRFRSQLTEAVKHLDDRLEKNALNEGESREGTLRITFEPPLGCDFLVDSPRQTVWVIAIWKLE